MELTYKLLTPGPLTTTRSVKEQMLFDHCTWDDDYKRITQDIRAHLLRLAHVAPERYTAVLMQGSDCIYAVAEAPMAADPNVAVGGVIKHVKIGADIASARWLDTGKKIAVKDNGFTVEPFAYGTSRVLRVAEIKLK